MKQYQSKSQDAERELHFLRTKCKKIESERTELSTELGNCLKERNRLVGRTAELEKLTRYGKRGGGGGRVTKGGFWWEKWGRWKKFRGGPAV